MMTLNEKLTHLRKKEGLSQIEVSEKLAVSRQAVSRWESGESRPSTDNLQVLCKLCHIVYSIKGQDIQNTFDGKN